MTTVHQPRRQHSHPVWAALLRVAPPLLVALGCAFAVLMMVG